MFRHLPEYPDYGFEGLLAAALIACVFMWWWAGITP